MAQLPLSDLQSNVDMVFVNARWFAGEITKKGLTAARIRDLDHTRDIQRSAVEKRQHEVDSLRSRAGASLAAADRQALDVMSRKLKSARMWLAIKPRQVVIQPDGAGPRQRGMEFRDTIRPGRLPSARMPSRVKTLPGLGPASRKGGKGTSEADELYEAVRLLDGEDRHDGIPPTKRSPGNDAQPPTRRDGAGARGVDRQTDNAWRTALTGLRRARRNYQPDPPPSSDAPTRRKGSGESETGWDLALRRSANARQLSPQHANAARKRIRAAAAPAFAAALDSAVDANLLARFAARHPVGVDAAKLRAAYAETANRAFATEFVALVGGQPPASAEDIALGAIIAVAIAQTTSRYPIVPAERVGPMAVLVHRSLRPQLPQLARMAAVIAAAPAAPARPSAPTHELAW